MPTRWGTSDTGYKGPFGDRFFSDCWDITTRTKQVVTENVTQEIPEEKVKPWFRKTHLSHVNDDDIYQVMLEVSNFKPTDINVKLQNDRTIVVEGKHAERKDTEGYIAREFTRKYTLPDSVNPSTVEAFLSKDGVLVIRGHAPRTRPLSPSRDKGQPISIYTNGYPTRHYGGWTSSPGKEVIIPISQEAWYKKGETKTETLEDSLHSGRSSRLSDRTKSPSPMPRTRTVSFGDENTFRSTSPIIEEPASIASNGTTPEPGTSRKLIPPLSRQDNFDQGSVSSEYRSSSRSVSEERIQRTTSPTSYTKTTREPVRALDIIFQKHDDILSRSKSPFEDLDKWHKEAVERHRQLSRESLERMQKDSEKWLDSVRSRSPLFQHRSNDDIFGSALKRIDEPLRWESKYPPVSKEEVHEKKHEKGYDKDGKWKETFEEKVFQQQYSSYGSNNNLKPSEFRGIQKSLLERPINISSPA